MDDALRPHRRFNPLTGQWIVVSPHRADRPWQGATERVASPDKPQHDPDCYLCPGNTRVGGAQNPDYDGTWWFPNDFAALLEDVPDDAAPAGGSGLLQSQQVTGTCRVLCFSPRHDLTMARMETADVRAVVDLWAEQVADLGRRYPSVQIFENRGEAMGASNPHPHGQLWATSMLPNELAAEDANQRAHRAEFGRPLLLDALDQELADGARVVVENDHWVVLVPYWATWPFETLVLPRRHVRRLPELTDPERDALAAILGAMLVRFDNLFEHPFPYSMGWHGAPGASEEAGFGTGEHWQLHGHFYPPLLRSATVRKYMVGFELLAEVQRDLTAEQAAARLREVPSTHYLSG